MKPAMIALSLFLAIPAYSWAADKTIEIITTPRGIADEVIKIDEHKQRKVDTERERVRAEKAEEAENLARVGHRYLENNEIDKAIEYFEKALAADETNIDAHNGNIQAMKVRDEAELGISERYHRAMVFLRKGLPDQAADALVAEIKDNPDNPAARDKLKEIEALQ